MKILRLAAFGTAAVSAVLWIALEANAAAGGGSVPRPSTPRPTPSDANQQSTEADFEKAEYLIKGEKYEEAIPLLQNVVAANPNDADAWNYLGFANRKLGKNEEALGHYQKALAIDPDHKGAHEYLGELYLQMNDLAKAEQQLAILQRLCPDGCEELEDLEADIADYKADNPA